MIRSVLAFGGGTLNHEMMDFFGFVGMPSCLQNSAQLAFASLCAVIVHELLCPFAFNKVTLRPQPVRFFCKSLIFHHGAHSGRVVEDALAHTQVFGRDLQQLVVRQLFQALLQRQNLRRRKADGLV